MYISHKLDATLQAENYKTIVREFTGHKVHAETVFARITDAAEKKVEELLFLSRLPWTRRRIALCVKETFALKT